MTVTLVEEYNPGWPAWFAGIKDYLGEQIARTCIRIEHVGSTAIPGMVAKPIIDLDIVIGPGTFPRMKTLLEGRGYFHEGDKGLPGREAFAIGDENTLPPHHLYVCEEGNPELRKHLAFREYLKQHPDEAASLSALKRSLAERLANDRQAYIDGKAAVCGEITEKALRWLEEEPA